jgi:hypothetical protein
MAKARASFSFSEDEPIVKEGLPEKIPKSVEKKASTKDGLELVQHTLKCTDRAWFTIDGLIRKRQMDGNLKYKRQHALEEIADMLEKIGIKPYEEGFK